MPNSIDIASILPGTTLQLEVGAYELITPPAPRRTAAWALPPGVTIAGRGRGTVLVFKGDLMGADWRGIQMASGCTIRDLRIDAGALEGGAGVEQAHCIRADGPSEDLAIERVSFHHPATGGSCIQFVGYEAGDRVISKVGVRGCQFESSGRSGIDVHSGLHDAEFCDLTFGGPGLLGVPDQDIDTEGDGGGKRRIKMHHNVHNMPSAPQSEAAVEIQDLDDLEFHDNQFNGRGLFVFGCTNSEFHHNKVMQRKPANGAAVGFSKAVDNVWIHHETYVRALGALHSPVLAIVPAGSVSPRNVRVTDCDIEQNECWTGISAIGVAGLTFERVRYTYGGYGAARIGLAVQCGTGQYAVQTRDIVVSGCSFDSFSDDFEAPVFINSGAGAVRVSDNRATKSKRGLWTGIGVGPLTEERNQFPT